MKNLLKMFLTAVCITAFSIPAFAYPDVSPNHWAAKEIETLTQQGVIVGYPDGTFRPDEYVTRAEFASMAIKSLGQEHTVVAQPVNFTDIDPTFWAYDAIQKALYFDLISCPPSGQPFRPEDSVSRGEAISVAVNALTTEQISYVKAKEVLSHKYLDSNAIPEWFVVPAGKAEILNMLVTMPSSTKLVDADRAATRAEVAAILYEMMRQAKLNPNAKLAEAMRKKTGKGYVVENATVQGSIGTIPAGTVVPIQLTKYASSQKSQAGEIYTAVAPENYVTKENYILVRKGAALKGQLLDVRSGQWFVRNGVLVFDNALITTANDQTAAFSGVSDIKKSRNWFMKIVRATLKGEKLEATPDNTILLKLLKPVRVDLTNGWIFE
jgi:hypothetical protein